MVGQLARRIGREVDRDEWIEGHAEVDAARRAVDERGFGDDFAAGGAHRLHRLARRPAGGHAVLDPQTFRARFAREAAAQLRSTDRRVGTEWGSTCRSRWMR